MNGDMRRAWIELDAAALAHNWRTLNGMLPPGGQAIAVVKGNAYGHGDLLVARELAGLGARRFAVACLDEAIRLRNGGVDGDVLVLGYTAPEEAPLAERFGLTLTAVDAEHARALDAAGTPLRVQLALDTGMHRLGADSGDAEQLQELFRLKHLTVAGMFSHLAAPEDGERTRMQLEQFRSAIAGLRAAGLDPGECHIQASEGLLRWPGMGFECARLGLALYGVSASPRGRALLKPVLSLRTRVASVRRVGAGERVGYGEDWIAPSPRAIATLSAGYVDGVPEAMARRGCALIHGRRAPLVGRICMDLMMADVTDIADVQPGDVATLIGRDGDGEIRCECAARAAGTTPVALLSRLGARLTRFFA